MLDFNHSPRAVDVINASIDRSLQIRNSQSKPRDYLGGSRLGVPCDRALQYEAAHAPKDPGKDFPGRLLRVFEIGHALEALAAEWLRSAGFDLRTDRRNGSSREQWGFSTAEGRIRGHVDGIIMGGPTVPGMAYPAIWECKTMNASSYRKTVTEGVARAHPAYAAQIAVYQAYMDAQAPGVCDNPALFTAIHKDSAEIYAELVPYDGELAQRASDRGVRVLQAIDSGTLLPRVASTRDYYVCRMCPWAERCWSPAD